MKSFFGFGKRKNVVPAKAEIHNLHHDSLKSEFSAHREIMKTIGPKLVSEMMGEYDVQLKQAKINTQSMKRILIDEYLQLEKMGLSESEMRNELEQKIKQFLPHKR